MTMKSYINLRSSLLTLIIYALTVTGCSQSTGFRNVIEYPGNLELVYYGYQLNNPSQYKVIAAGKEFFITKTTVVPSIQSMFLLENTVINEDDVVLDIGT